MAGSGAVSVQSANLRTMKAFLGQPGCGGLNGRGLRKDEGPQRAAKGNNTGERTGLARGQGSREDRARERTGLARGQGSREDRAREIRMKCGAAGSHDGFPGQRPLSTVALAKK